MTPPSDAMLIDVDVCELTPSIGLGIVARDHVPAGTTVAVFGGTATTAAAFSELSDDRRAWSIQVADDVYLVPVGDTSPAVLINHSCEPTCRLAGQIQLVAARDLRPGDPITYDYATSDSSPYDEFECECGAASCRVKVTGDDWMRPEVQDRYDGWFSPYLQAKVDALRAADRDPSGGLVRTPSSR